MIYCDFHSISFSFSLFEDNMVHYYTAEHPNVFESFTSMFEGEIDWFIASKYPWSDPNERRDPENPYGTFADSRIEVLHTGKTFEELQLVENKYPNGIKNNQDLDILLHCYHRTETSASFAQYNLSHYGEMWKYALIRACKQQVRSYNRRKNNFKDEGDFKYDVEIQENIIFPGMKEFTFPTVDSFPKPVVEKNEPVNEDKPKKKNKGCIIC